MTVSFNEKKETMELRRRRVKTGEIEYWSRGDDGSDGEDRAVKLLGRRFICCGELVKVVLATLFHGRNISY
uniref:Uncharacterized protein n=1 Tax=Hyaloperonospora arabidopsidis (strain Emoy2) TaxID=559515 RepID=M4BYK9_HYAAE